MKGVAITGMGIISSIGNSVEENYISLIENKIGISGIQNIQTVHADVIKVGEIKKTNEELVAELQLSENNNFSGGHTQTITDNNKSRSLGLLLIFEISKNPMML